MNEAPGNSTQPIERALVAFGIDGEIGTVLAVAGKNLSSEVDGFSVNPDDIWHWTPKGAGKDSGIWVWEGRPRYEEEFSEGVQVAVQCHYDQGEWRRATQNEITFMSLGKSPWRPCEDCDKTGLDLQRKQEHPLDEDTFCEKCHGEGYLENA